MRTKDIINSLCGIMFVLLFISAYIFYSYYTLEDLEVRVKAAEATIDDLEERITLIERQMEV